MLTDELQRVYADSREHSASLRVTNGRIILTGEAITAREAALSAYIEREKAQIYHLEELLRAQELEQARFQAKLQIDIPNSELEAILQQMRRTADLIAVRDQLYGKCGGEIFSVEAIGSDTEIITTYENATVPAIREGIQSIYDTAKLRQEQRESYSQDLAVKVALEVVVRPGKDGETELYFPVSYNAKEGLPGQINTALEDIILNLACSEGRDKIEIKEYGAYESENFTRAIIKGNIREVVTALQRVNLPAIAKSANVEYSVIDIEYLRTREVDTEEATRILQNSYETMTVANGRPPIVTVLMIRMDASSYQLILPLPVAEKAPKGIEAQLWDFCQGNLEELLEEGISELKRSTFRGFQALQLSSEKGLPDLRRALTRGEGRRSFELRVSPVERVLQ